ncbi:MAG: DUF2971 domain-containing protein [Bradyrhizobiaceae bacterium]|nr:MAG: DUF2971 domain-containing protein [Bradyrhizobiaceae bacterium]
MTALERFLDEFGNSFDVSQILDSDVEVIESIRYPNPVIYKYYSSARSGFFSRPQIRFSPREALNDPFEMSRKWKNISADKIRDGLKVSLAESLSATFSNPVLLAEMFNEEQAVQGSPLSESQVSLVRSFLESEQGKAFLERQFKLAAPLVEPMLEHVFAKIESQLEQLLDGTVSKIGVLSLSEDGLSDLMWAHYGECGKGFVVGLKYTDAFFHPSDGGLLPALKKVIYTDQWIENFWKNPYYLFLVKPTRWSYEKEWRIFKKFSTSDKEVIVGKDSIHLWNLSPEIISSIHFGYNYPDHEIEKNKNEIRSFGSDPVFYKIKVNRDAGVLEAHELS